MFTFGEQTMDISEDDLRLGSENTVGVFEMRAPDSTATHPEATPEQIPRNPVGRPAKTIGEIITRGHLLDSLREVARRVESGTGRTQALSDVAEERGPSERTLKRYKPLARADHELHSPISESMAPSLSSFHSMKQALEQVQASNKKMQQQASSRKFSPDRGRP